MTSLNTTFIGRKVPKLPGPNRAQNLRFTYVNDGVMITPRDETKTSSPWRVEVRLSADELGLLGLVEPQWIIGNNQAEMHALNLAILYINSPEGMRQNFLVLQKETAGQPLRLRFSVETIGLLFAVNEAGDGVSFFDAGGGAEVLGYTDLHVWDASGRSLAASMVPDGMEGFAIQVEDVAALYPVFVDPIFLARNVTGTQSGASFGYSVAPSGDLEGKIDTGGIIIGAPYFDDGQTDEGKIFVFYSGNNTTLPTDPTWTAQSDQAFAKFGWSVAGDFDVNGDGKSDILVGAPDYDGGLYSNNGRVFLWYGRSDGVGNATSTVTSGTPGNVAWDYSGDQNGAKLGYSITTADFNFDGVLPRYFDIVIGIPYEDIAPSTDDGQVKVFYGAAAGLADVPNVTLNGTAQSRFGWSLASGKDIQGGSPDMHDLVVGAPFEQNGSGQEVGAARVYFSNSRTGLSTTPTILLGPQAGAQFGFSVAMFYGEGFGGFADVIVGAPRYDGDNTDEGQVFVYFGASTGLDTTVDWTATIGQPFAYFGYSVTAGQFGGPTGQDIFEDILIGAPFYDYPNYLSSLTDCGIIVLWFANSSGQLGSNGTLANAAWWDVTNAANTQYGTSVSYTPKYAKSSVPAFLAGAPDGNGSVKVWYWGP